MLKTSNLSQLEPFSGTDINVDLTQWLEKFNNMYNVRYPIPKCDPAQLPVLKGHHLRIYLAEPALTLVTYEASTDPEGPLNYNSLVRAMKRLYINDVTIQLARSELLNMKQQPNESIAVFSNRFSRCIERAYPNDPPTVFINAKVKNLPNDYTP